MTARNFGSGSASTLDYNYAVVVLDPEEGTAQVYQPELFVPTRTIKALIESPANDDGDANNSAVSSSSSTAASRPTTPVDYKAAKTLLGESFGTKKTKQAIHSKERNQINLQQLEQASKGFLSRAIDENIERLQSSSEKSKEGDKSSPSAIISAEHLLIPPYNPKTTKVEEIYTFDNLLAQIVQTELAEQASEVEAIIDRNGSWEEWKRSHHFYNCSWILDRLESTNAISDGNDQAAKLSRRRHILALLYMLQLLAFRNLKEGSINSETARSKGLPGCTPALIDHLLTLFAESFPFADGSSSSTKRYRIPQTHSDRLTAYIIVLALYVSPSWRVNLTAFATTVLHMALQRAVDHFRAVGCVIERPGEGEPTTFTAPNGGRCLQVKFARLAAPITFPKIRRGGPSK